MTKRDLLYSLLAVPVAYIIKPFIPIFLPREHLKKIAFFLSKSDRLADSDAIAVLGGGSISRIRYGVSLYHQGFAERLIVHRNVRTQWPVKVNNISTISEAKRLGVNSKDLIHESESNTTADEAKNLKRILSRFGYRSVIVITDGYHLRRTRIIFNETFRRSHIKLLFHSSGSRGFNPNNWWKRSTDVSNLISEYFSIGFLNLTHMILSWTNVREVERENLS